MSVRAGGQGRLFNAEPPVVRITAVAAVLVLLVGLAAAVGHTDTKKRAQGVATRGRAGAGTSSVAPGNASAAGSTAGSGGTASGPGATVTGPRGGVAGGDQSAGQAGTGVAPDGSVLTASDRGVSATKIKVVFPYADLGPIGAATGLDPGTEDEPTAIKAYVNDINSRGGVNGRLIDPEIVKYNPLDDAEMRADCKDWTESQEVFAVVDSYGWHDDHQLC